MEDRREQILKKCDELTDGLIWDGNGDIIKFDGPIHTIYEAMDIYMRETCLELLEYMAKNRIVCGTFSGSDEDTFYFKGDWITKEQLFENFL